MAPPDAMTVRWLTEHAIHFHPLPMARAAVAPLGDALVAFRLHKKIRQLRPQMVLTWTIKPTVYGIPAALIARVPRRHAFITGLGYAFTDRRKLLRWRIVNAAARLLYSASLRLATTVTFQNEDDREDFRSLGLLGRTPAHVVNGSGVDLERFKVAPLPEEPRFLLIARLLRDKGLAEYLAAARLVKAARPEACFDLVGDTDPNPSGFPLSEVEAAVTDGTIRYHGPVEDVRQLIAAARILRAPLLSRGHFAVGAGGDGDGPAGDYDGRARLPRTNRSWAEWSARASRRHRRLGRGNDSADRQSRRGQKHGGA